MSLKIALNTEDEKVAQIIVAFYPVKLERQMIQRALKIKNFDFIYTVWAFEKNYEINENYEKSFILSFDYLFK